MGPSNPRIPNQRDSDNFRNNRGNSQDPSSVQSRGNTSFGVVAEELPNLKGGPGVRHTKAHS